MNNEIKNLKDTFESVFGPVSIRQYPLDHSNNASSTHWISGVEYQKELRK